jgi:hypothetical protein
MAQQYVRTILDNPLVLVFSFIRHQMEENVAQNDSDHFNTI